MVLFFCDEDGLDGLFDKIKLIVFICEFFFYEINYVVEQKFLYCEGFKRIFFLVFKLQLCLNSYFFL